MDYKLFRILMFETIICRSGGTMMIDSPAPMEIWEEAFNNADYLHQ